MDACAANLRCLIGAFHSRGGAAVCAIVANFLAEEFKWGCVHGVIWDVRGTAEHYSRISYRGQRNRAFQSSGGLVPVLSKLWITDDPAVLAAYNRGSQRMSSPHGG